MNPKYPSIFFANNLNEQLNKFWLPSPLVWNSQTKKWEFVEMHKLPFFISSTTAKLTWFLSCICAVYLGFQNPDLCTSSHLVCLGLQAELSLLFIVADYLISFDCENLPPVLNWCYQTNNWIRNNGRRQPNYFLATILCGNIIFVTLAGIAGVIFGAESNLDPMIVAIWHFQLFDKNLQIVKMFRMVIGFCFYMVYTVTYRELCITAIVAGWYRIKILKALTHCAVAEKYIKIYRENMAVTQVLHIFEYKVSTLVLVGLFLAMLCSVNALLISYTRGAVVLAFMAATVIFGATLFLHVIFTVGCCMFQFSSQILTTWKFGAFFTRDKKYLRRVVRSLRLVTLPAGKVGIIDKDIKVNYSYHALGYIVDSIMINPQLQNQSA